MKNIILKVLAIGSLFTLMLFLTGKNVSNFSQNEILENIISLNTAQAESEVIAICVYPWDKGCITLTYPDGTKHTVPGKFVAP